MAAPGLSCALWNLLARLGISSGPSALGAQTKPPGKSHLHSFLILCPIEHQLWNIKGKLVFGFVFCFFFFFFWEKGQGVEIHTWSTSGQRFPSTGSETLQFRPCSPSLETDRVLSLSSSAQSLPPMWVWLPWGGNRFMCVTHGECRGVSSWAAQVGLLFYCTLNQINSKDEGFCMIF